MIRRHFTALGEDELDALATALNRLWEDGAIQAKAKMHDQNFWTGIHWGPAFLPWHRDLLWDLERQLQEIEPTLTLPYWDWTRADSRDLDRGPWATILGGRANSGGRFDHWSYTRNSDDGGRTLPTLDTVVGELRASSFLGLRALETGSHVPGHTWTGGTMSRGDSPLDPLFYLHHCNLDRIWAIWQLNHADQEQYEHEGVAHGDKVPQARVPLDHPMIGGATPASVLDHEALGYAYERDTALEQAWADAGLGLLQTGA